MHCTGNIYSDKFSLNVLLLSLTNYHLSKDCDE